MRISPDGQSYIDEVDEYFDVYEENGIIAKYIENKIKIRMSYAENEKDESVFLRVLKVLRKCGVEPRFELNKYLKENISAKITPLIIEQNVKPIDASISISISTEKDRASICIKSPSLGGMHAKVEDIEKILAKEKIVYGVDGFILSEIINEKKYDQHISIAVWTPPVNGSDAEIEHLIDFSTLGKPLCNDSNADVIDLKSIDNIRIVKKGEVLCRKKPVDQGKPGINIHGKSVSPPKPKDVQILLGKNTLLSEDKNELTASRDGVVQFINETYSVSPLLTINGDVDYSTGNVDFDGAIIVNGSIRSGFNVKCKDKLFVRGSIEQAKVFSEDDIVVSGGLHNSDVTSIKNVTAEFAEHSKISSDCIYIVKGHMLYCKVRAIDEVIVSESENSKIIGGEIISGRTIKSVYAGNTQGTRTIFKIELAKEILAEKERLEDEIEDMKVNIARSEERLSKMSSIDSLYANTTKRIFKTRNAIIEANKKLSRINSDIYRSENCGLIEIKKTCYPGVLITIKSTEKEIKTEYVNTSFKFDAGEIIFNQLN